MSLAPEQIRLAVGRSSGYYVFNCPSCHDRITKPADERVTTLLLAGGVMRRPIPAAPVHPEAPPDGPPLIWDDLLDLRLQLDRPDWFERLLESRP